MLYFTEADSLAQLFSMGRVMLYLGMSFINTLLLVMISYKFLQIMQQSGYEGFGYFRWLRRRDNIYLTRLAIISMLSFLGFLLTNITLAFVDKAWVFYVGFVFYVLFVIGYYNSEKKRTKKIPLVFTSRMKRLIVVYVLVLFAVSFIAISLLTVLAYYLRFNSLLVRVRFAPICLMPIGIPVYLLLAHYVIKPYENKHQMNYIKKCMAKLHSRPDLIKIGITGSYGKTSVKEILRTILEEKYSVLSTPSSYNTPMGICKTVKKLKAEHKVFIAEMGARHVGDIKELANIVKPDYAIISGIVGQHLETFGSIEAIRRTKYELVESLDNGTVAYTVDNENTISLFTDEKVKSIPAGLNLSASPTVYAKDMATSSEGCDFTLCYKGEECKCHTALLGKHNVSNICLASAIALELGLSLGEISGGISRLTPIKHRLEVIRNSRGITVIDDSYNCNTRGISAALDVLSSFDGRKIVVTPGLVELGRTEDIENYRFGKMLAKVCDYAVLVGRSASFLIQDGMIDGGFDMDKIIIAKDLDAATKKLSKILQKGDVVLFENDLPDKFS